MKTDTYNLTRGSRIFGRFKVHPDKVLIRIWPIKADDKQTGLWIPPATQRREMSFRWARIIQIGWRINKEWFGFDVGDTVICNKYVDAVYGKEGKFKLGGKFVCVTMPSEILMKVNQRLLASEPGFRVADPKSFIAVDGIINT